MIRRLMRCCCRHADLSLDSLGLSSEQRCHVLVGLSLAELNSSSFRRMVDLRSNLARLQEAIARIRELASRQVQNPNIGRDRRDCRQLSFQRGSAQLNKRTQSSNARA